MSIPNLLSLLRLVLVPVFAVVFFQPAPDAHRWAVLIYLTAFLTDVADGWIARHFNQITKLGRILDPLADKLMTFTVIICITADGIIPLWAVVVFFLKELTMAIGGYLMYQKLGDVISSNWLGKTSTGVFFCGLRRAGALPCHPTPLGHRTDLLRPGPHSGRPVQLYLPVPEGFKEKKTGVIHTQFIISN